MQSRSFFLADVVHLCLGLNGSRNGRRLARNAFSEYGVRHSYHILQKLRHPQLRKVPDRTQVTIGRYDTRKLCHGCSKTSKAPKAAFEGIRDEPQDQAFRSRLQLNSKSKAKFCHKPALRSTVVKLSKTYATMARMALPRGKFNEVQKTFYNVHRSVKAPYPSPTFCLAQWVDAKSEEERWFVWNDLAWRGERWTPSLSSILLQYLYHLEFIGTETAVATDEINRSASEVLVRSGFSMDDVHLWASIVTATTGEEATRRYLSTSRAKPLFILLEVLRWPRLTTTSFRLLLIHAWDRCLGLTAEHLVPQIEGEAHHASDLNLESFTPKLGIGMEPLSFERLMTRLLIHSRQVWAPAVISLSHFFVIYWKQISADRASQGSDLSMRLHARLCKAYNWMICQLANPASMAPMKSMRHNWDAQKILLESADRLSPAPILNQESYRAVSRVLLALKKSEPETKYAGLLHRSWPPWRIDQDGMDGERSPEDDISRAVATNYQMKEAGYKEQYIDKTIRILGGRESDGTPTIPTRYIVRSKQPILGSTTSTRKARGTIDDSAARIVATRDAREAWAVFLSITSSRGRPTYSMYHIMLEKLIYHATAGNQTRGLQILPGCGKEPISLPDDNISESERRRTQPPDFWTLYAEMIQDGIRPSGRFLEMLIAHAADFNEVRIYLEDSGMSEQDARILTRGPYRTGHNGLHRIQPRIVLSFIKFLSSMAHLHKLTPNQRSPMILAFDLVRCCRFQSPVALYALIVGLSDRELQFSSTQSMCRDRMTAWGLVTTSLSDFQKLNGDLNPRGLQLVCRALELALPAFKILYQTVPAPERSGLQVVKKIFKNLSVTVKPSFALPGLLHEFEGAHLHAYVRVLCLSRDMDEIVSLLQWVVQHQHELLATAEEGRNGGNLLRRTLIAIRALLESDDENECAVLHQIRNLVNQLDGWGGWPTRDEIVEYLNDDPPGWAGVD